MALMTDTEIEAEKLCSRCRSSKPLSEFYLDKSKQYAPRSQCKACERLSSVARGRKRSTTEIKERRKFYRAKLIEDIGGECACCGETTYEFLQIDHIDNNGGEHRKKIGRSLSPSDYYVAGLENFQILCANCHSAKSWHGSCPCAGKSNS